MFICGEASGAIQDLPELLNVASATNARVVIRVEARVTDLAVSEAMVVSRKGSRIKNRLEIEMDSASSHKNHLLVENPSLFFSLLFFLFNLGSAPFFV